MLTLAIKAVTRALIVAFAMAAAASARTSAVPAASSPATEAIALDVRVIQPISNSFPTVRPPLPPRSLRASAENLRLVDPIWQRDVAAAPDGSVWFVPVHNGDQSDGFYERVGRYDPGTQTMVIWKVPRIGVEGGIPEQAEHAGFFLATNVVMRMSPSGVAVAFPRLAPGDDSEQLVRGRDGAYWIFDSLHGRFDLMDTASLTTTLYPKNGWLYSGGNLVVDRDRNFWFNEPRMAVGRFDSITHVVKEFVIPGPSRSIDRLAASPDGSIWFTIAQFGIGRLDPASGRSRLWPVDGANCIALDPDSRPWVCAHGYFGPFDIAARHARLYSLGTVPSGDEDQPLTAVNAQDITFGNDGQVTVHTDQGVAQIDLARRRAVMRTNPLDPQLDAVARASGPFELRLVGAHDAMGPPTGIAADSGGFWVADTGRLVRIGRGGAIDRVVYPVHFVAPADFLSRGDGTLVYAQGGEIDVVSRDGFVKTYRLGSLHAWVDALAMGRDGTFWYSSDMSLVDVEPNGAALATRVGGRPQEVIVDANGVVWCTDESGFIDRLVDGTVSRFPVPTAVTVTGDVAEIPIPQPPPGGY